MWGMDRAWRPQRQEPALELELRRWRRRRLLLPSPPVSEHPRPGPWLRPFMAPPPRVGRAVRGECPGGAADAGPTSRSRPGAAWTPGRPRSGPKPRA